MRVKGDYRKTNFGGTTYCEISLCQFLEKSAIPFMPELASVYETLNQVYFRSSNLPVAKPS